MLKDLSAVQFNEAFLDKIASVQGQAELTEAGRQYVKTELQEAAFSRAILPQEPITTADCQRNVNDNSLYLIRDIEPDAAALGVDNLGEPDGQYVRGTRYIIPIVNFVTKRFQITVEDLRAYQYKITKRIEDKSVPVLEKLEDTFFMRLVGAAVNVSGNRDKSIDSVGTTNLTINQGDFIKLKNTLSAGINGSDPKRKEVGCILMTQEAFESAVVLPGSGDDFGKDRVLNGITSDTLYGTKIVKTIKSDLLPVGHLWAFTTPDFLGHNFALGDPNFEIKSNFGLIEWQTKESIGMGIGNALSVALLTLQGSSAPGVTFVSGGASGADLTMNFGGGQGVNDGTTQAEIIAYYAGLTV
jgi:hypothetical protein